VHQLLLAGVGASGDGVADPVLEPGEDLVAGREGAGGDQDAAQVPEGLAVGQLVEDGVGERLVPGGEPGEQVADLVTADPAQGDSSGAAQPAQSGWARVPALTGARFPHLEQVAQELAQVVHQGVPVTLEIMHGAVRPQIVQFMTWRGLQLPQTGPSRVRVATRCRRPQREQSSRLDGSLIRQ
jgi:hypothetical protein